MENNKTDNNKSETRDKALEVRREKREKKKEEFIEVFKENLGIITISCNKVGISRDAYYDWYNDDEDFKAKIEGAKQIQRGDVEDRLFKAITDGNITAIIFYLKSKHPDYKNRVELSGGLNINKYENLTDEQLEQQIRELEEGKEGDNGSETGEVGE